MKECKERRGLFSILKKELKGKELLNTFMRL